MIILDKPYVSKEIKAYLDKSQTPVLKTELALAENNGHNFNLLESEKFAQLFTKNSRLYTLSENSIAWIKDNIDNKALIEAIELMKDKYLFREKVSSLYPHFFFKRLSLDKLESTKIEEKQFPLILKPIVGFFSANVYVLNNKDDYAQAVKNIKENLGHWQKLYPSSVIGENEFILEEYIDGDEYAVDAYFDEEGRAVVLNILRHEFTAQEDVSDRLYYTSKEIIEEKLALFESYLNKVNEILQIKNFPFHVEIRINTKDEIVPIEFNPLRFAGWNCTDISLFAFGFHTYDYYLNNIAPNWNKLLQGKDNILYSLIILTKPASYTKEMIFDFDLFKKDLSNILCLRELDYTKDENPFAFVFAQTPLSSKEELDKIARSDLTEYLK